MAPADRSQHTDGVFFRQEDCAGLWRRLIADAIDVSVAVVSLSLVFALGPPFSLLWILVAFAYFVLLKRSSGTLGYRITRVRIVNLRGQVPSVPVVTLRLIFSLMTGWFGFIEDLSVMQIDPHRQAFRDKLFGTYVIKTLAQPAGTGRIAYDMYCLWMHSFMLPRVRKCDQAVPRGVAR